MRYLTLSLRRICLIILFCLALVTFPFMSQGSQAENLPDFGADYGGWVTDKADILSPATEGQLQTMISRLKEKYGTEIAVVTVPQTSPYDSPQAFATALFEQWEVGQPVPGNGILLLISEGDRRVEITTGYGVEPILSDAKVSEVLEAHIMPHLKEGNFDAGVLNGTQALMAAIANPDYRFSLALAKRQRLWLLSGGMAVISILSYGLVRFCCRPILLVMGYPPQQSRVKFLPPPQPLSKGDSMAIVERLRGYFRAIAVGILRSPPEQQFTLVLDLCYGTSWTGILALSFLVMAQGLEVMLVLLFLPYLKLIPAAICKGQQQDRVTGKQIVIGALIVGFFLYQLLHWLASLLLLFPVVSAIFIAFTVAFTFAPLLVGLLTRGMSNELIYLDAETRQPLSAVAPDILNSYLSEAQKVSKRLGSRHYQGFCNAQGAIHIRVIEVDSHYQECPHCQELTVSRTQQTLKRANLSSYGIRLVILTCECCGNRTEYHQGIPARSHLNKHGSDGDTWWIGWSCSGDSSFGGGSSDGGDTGGDF